MLISIIEINHLTSYSCVWLDWIDHWSFTLVYGLFHIWYSHTTHKTFDSMNVYFICVIVHVQMWCVYSIACRSNPIWFLSILYIFESVFMLLCFDFLFILYFSCFSSKTPLEAFSREGSQISSSCKSEKG